MAMYRVNRSIQVEGAFGVLKNDYNFQKFLLRGKTKVMLSYHYYDESDKDKVLRDMARGYERMTMRSHSNGGYVNALDECWKMCEKFNANIIFMYNHVSCKNFAGLQGLFEEQARERGLHLIWVEHDLMDPRTVSRKSMREKVNRYMETVMRATPLDPSLIDYDDDLTW